MAVERAHAVFTGAEKLPSRPKEREYFAECLVGAYSLLHMFSENEADLRAYIACRKAARERGAIGEPAPSAPRYAPAQAPVNSKTPCEYPLARRAAMRCAEVAFQKFLGVETAEAAAISLRERCDVASRKNFDLDAAARERWRAVEAEFSAWLSCAAESDGSATQ
ncbi:hypothetical protein EDE12_106158 [Methylosinus sp. sav-2]|nr:hypothetical protein EDE12_106158 [Methylosinus sp. sav-2]